MWSQVVAAIVLTASNLLAQGSPAGAREGRAEARCTIDTLPGVQVFAARLHRVERNATSPERVAQVRQDFVRAVSAILGGERSPADLLAAADGQMALSIGCDAGIDQRDRAAYALTALGYTEAETADMLLGRATRAQIDGRLIQRMAGFAEDARPASGQPGGGVPRVVVADAGDRVGTSSAADIAPQVGPAALRARAVERVGAWPSAAADIVPQVGPAALRARAVEPVGAWPSTAADIAPQAGPAAPRARAVERVGAWPSTQVARGGATGGIRIAESVGAAPPSPNANRLTPGGEQRAVARDPDLSARVQVRTTAARWTPVPRPLPAIAAAPTSSPALLAAPPDIDAYVRRVAADYQVDYGLVSAMIRHESNWEHNSVSSKGAIGLMQLMPGTAAMLGVNPRDPVENVRGGVAYLSSLLRTYNDTRLALIAYNAGPDHANKVITGESVLYPETRRYLESVGALYRFAR